MNKAPLPEEVKRFILVAIPSVPYLEATLLMRKESHNLWDEKILARRIYISESLANELLLALHSSGVVEIDAANNAYRYSPMTNDLREMIDSLAESYSKNLVEITILIHSKTGKKAQQFADAFKLRKDS